MVKRKITKTINATYSKDFTDIYTTQWNYTPKKGKKFFEKGETQPGMGMSIKDVMERAAQGLPIMSDPRMEVYGTDPDFLPIQPNADILDMYTMAEKAGDTINKHKAESKKAEIESKEARSNDEQPTKAETNDQQKT